MAEPEPRCPKCGGPWHLYCGNDEVDEDAEEAARYNRIYKNQPATPRRRK